MKKKSCLLLFFTFIAICCFAQTDREFWFVAPNVDDNNANFNIPIVLRMTSFSSAATVTISLPANPSFIPLVINIAANSTQTVDLSTWVNLLQNAPPDNVLNKGILIQSTADITAYYEVVSSYCSCNPEVFSLKGKNALGNEFYISSQYTYNIDTTRQPAATTSFDIVATQDNTTVTITPSKNIVGHLANIAFSIVLNTGQTYSAVGIYRDMNNHLQGSYVTSTKPIAVTLKDDLVFGDGTCADLIGDQTIPTNVLGNEYIVAKGYLQPHDRVFVLAIQDNTPIFLDGSSAPSIILNKGQSWTFDLFNESTYIQSDKKFYTYHVTGNGCELGSAIIPKLNCTGSSSVNIVRSTDDIFGLMLITKSGNQGNFSVNGNSTAILPGNFSAVPGTAGTYVAGTIDLSAFLPAGNVFSVSNSSGKFSMGFINGSPIGGCRYGFFSDFKSSNVQTTQTVICPGDSTQLNAFGGVTYLWSPSAGLSKVDIANPKASPAITTIYKVIITDADGCTDSAFVDVTIDPTLPKSDFSFNQNICNLLEVSFSGPSQPGTTYSWIIDGTSYPGQNPVHDFNLFGSYPVTLNTTVASGCSGSLTKNITLQLNPADIIIPTDTTICSGKSIVLTTRPAVDFCWSPATYLDNPISANPTAAPPVSTKYYFTAKTIGANLVANGSFGNGNTGFTSAYIYDQSNQAEGEYFVGTSPHNWNANAPVSCGDHTNGTGNMMIINGSPGSGVNVWTSGQMVISPNTNYAFSIWIQSISPFSPAILQFSINGTELAGPVNANANTCTWNQFYTTWNSGSNTTATISLVNENTAVLGNDFALDDISFSPILVQTDSITIQVETPALTTSPDTAVCPGLPAPLRASGSLNYRWSPAVGLSDPSIADPVAAPAVTTSYVVTGSTAHGCSLSNTITVSIFPPQLSISPDTTICLGDAARLHASGGTSYSWSPGNYLDDPNNATPIAVPDKSTRFHVTITDINLCQESDSVEVSIRPVPSFQPPPDETTCKGQPVKLGSLNGRGYIYSWSPSDALNDPAAAVPTSTPNESMIYTVHIRDSLCVTYNAQFLVAVTARPAPNVIAQKANDIDCSIATAQLTASGGISYSWTPASGLSDPLSPAPIASIDSTTTYILQGIGDNGCPGFDTVTVKVSATGPNLFIVPNAFTPNGDGHNDCFGIRRWGDAHVEEFSIYNRWGMQVFTTRNPSDCWDGNFHGRPQETGGYAYVIKAHTFCGEVTRTGIVMLIR